MIPFPPPPPPIPGLGALDALRDDVLRIAAEVDRRQLLADDTSNDITAYATTPWLQLCPCGKAKGVVEFTGSAPLCATCAFGPRWRNGDRIPVPHRRGK